jgi:hypothetical protein
MSQSEEETRLIGQALGLRHLFSPPTTQANPAIATLWVCWWI